LTREFCCAFDNFKITDFFFAEQQIWLTTAPGLCIFSVSASFEQVPAAEKLFLQLNKPYTPPKIYLFIINIIN
jgi:hypothetical protein